MNRQRLLHRIGLSLCQILSNFISPASADIILRMKSTFWITLLSPAPDIDVFLPYSIIQQVIFDNPLSYFPV
jgi:hypothetical protein